MGIRSASMKLNFGIRQLLLKNVSSPALAIYGSFRMSNVSAYTASTQLGEGEDVVHWKTVDGDNANINGRKKINRNYPMPPSCYLFSFLSTFLMKAFIGS